MIKIKINTGNEAFDGDQRDYEVARILRELADNFENCTGRFKGLYDANGNQCGTVEYTGKDRC